MNVGGDQIEYDEEDPRIYQLFKQECDKSGVQVKMDYLLGR